MISDEERQEVAKKLRERTKKPMRESMQRMFTETLGMYTHNICWMNPDKATSRWDVIVNYLADLIDIPTCHDIGEGRVFQCSKCGCELDITDREGEATMWVDGIATVPKYCPNCRAKVVDDA